MYVLLFFSRTILLWNSAQVKTRAIDTLSKAISILHLVKILTSKHNIRSAKMTFFKTLVWTTKTVKCSSGEHYEMYKLVLMVPMIASQIFTQVKSTEISCKTLNITL